MFKELLKVREKRANLVKKTAQSTDVVTIKSNIVGSEKNIPLALLTTKYFAKKINEFGVKGLKSFYSVDGLTVLGKTNDGNSLKKQAISLEETHPLGRLIDIDITLKNQSQSLSRGSLRKCFLCENPAFVCGKNKTHKVEDLINYFNNTSKSYFHNLIAKIIKESMLEELNIEDKFGLVTKTSNGSHSDMNYTTMVKAIEVIKEDLVDAFFVGLNAKTTKNLIKKHKTHTRVA